MQRATPDASDHDLDSWGEDAYARQSTQWSLAAAEAELHSPAETLAADHRHEAAPAYASWTTDQAEGQGARDEPVY